MVFLIKNINKILNLGEILDQQKTSKNKENNEENKLYFTNKFLTIFNLPDICEPICTDNHIYLINFLGELIQYDTEDLKQKVIFDFSPIINQKIINMTQLKLINDKYLFFVISFINEKDSLESVVGIMNLKSEKIFCSTYYDFFISNMYYNNNTLFLQGNDSIYALNIKEYIKSFKEQKIKPILNKKIKQFFVTKILNDNLTNYSYLSQTAIPMRFNQKNFNTIYKFDIIGNYLIASTCGYIYIYKISKDLLFPINKLTLEYSIAFEDGTANVKFLIQDNYLITFNDKMVKIFTIDITNTENLKIKKIQTIRPKNNYLNIRDVEFLYKNNNEELIFAILFNGDKNLNKIPTIPFIKNESYLELLFINSLNNDYTFFLDEIDSLNNAKFSHFFKLNNLLFIIFSQKKKNKTDIYLAKFNMETENFSFDVCNLLPILPTKFNILKTIELQTSILYIIYFYDEFGNLFINKIIKNNSDLENAFKKPASDFDLLTDLNDQSKDMSLNQTSDLDFSNYLLEDISENDLTSDSDDLIDTIINLKSIL